MNKRDATRRAREDVFTAGGLMGLIMATEDGLDPTERSAVNATLTKKFALDTLKRAVLGGKHPLEMKRNDTIIETTGSSRWAISNRLIVAKILRECE